MTWQQPESSGWSAPPPPSGEPPTAALPPTPPTAPTHGVPRAPAPANISPWAAPSAWEVQPAHVWTTQQGPDGTQTLPTYQPGAAQPYPPAAYPYQPAWAPPPGQAPPGWPPPPGWTGQPPGWPPPPPPPRTNRAMIVAIIAGCVLAVIIAITGAILLNPSSDTPPSALNPTSGPTAEQPTAPASPSGGANSSSGLDADGIAARVDPAIVDINTTLGLQNARAAGTGVVLDPTGLILTNNHVIAGETEMSAVDIGDGRTYPATVVGYDQSEDIAVIQLSGASGLTVAPLGDSDSIEVGDPILALGNAGGVGGTPAAVTGRVTDTDQSITATDELGGSEHLTGLIEIAADIKPGDSGGPLVDSDGKVVGINTAASTGFQVQGQSGRGYAIPINQALSIAHEISAGHASDTIHIGKTAFLGVSTKQATGVDGAAVGAVFDGTAASRVGLKVGDIITGLDGSSVDSPTKIGALMVPHHPGDSVQLTWLDTNSRSHQATVSLGEGPPA